MNPLAVALRVLTHSIMAAAVISLAWAHGRYVGEYEFFASTRLPWTIAFIAFIVAASYAVGLPEEPAGGYRWAFGAAAAAGAIATVGISITQLLVGAQLLPRFVVFQSVLFAVAWYSLVAALADDLGKRPLAGIRVVVVGSSSEIERLGEELHGMPQQSGRVVASIEIEGENVARNDLVDVVRQARADIVVLDRNAFTDEGVVAQVVALHKRGIRVRTLSLFYEERLQKLPVSELERVSLLFDISELHNRSYGRIKRWSDVVAGLILALAGFVCAIVILVANMLGNRGPLLFRQNRVGRNGEVFVLLKFRTMRPGAEDSLWTSDNDARITPVGRFLRKAHIDELPQSWNILRGDLSLVGPRPEQPHYVRQLEAEIPFYDVRHLVRPGLTGWAQVRHQYGASVSDARQKLQYDFYYLRHQGLLLDARIVRRTLRSIVRSKGR